MRHALPYFAFALLFVLSCANPAVESASSSVAERTQALDNSCSLPRDRSDIAECNLCTRSAYAQYRAFHCDNGCDQTKTRECLENERQFWTRAATCKMVMKEQFTSYACCSGFDGYSLLLDGANLGASYASGGISSIAKDIVQGKIEDLARDEINLTPCPLGSALCEETSRQMNCPRKASWCVAVQGACVYDDPDMPFLCERSAANYGPCDDPSPCPPDMIKLIRRTQNVPLGQNDSQLCVPIAHAQKCAPFATPPTCPTTAGTCEECNDRHCPIDMRWDRVRHGCVSCPEGQAIAVEPATGATHCEDAPLCGDGLVRVDLRVATRCPRTCPTGLSCRWETGTCLNPALPCWNCPYCNAGNL